MLPAGYAVSKVQQALEKLDKSLLLEALRMAYLQLRDVKDENLDLYFDKLLHKLNEKKVRGTVHVGDVN